MNRPQSRTAQAGTTALIVAAIFAVTSVAFAAGAGKDPMKLALTKADFPANAQRMGGKAIDPKRLAELFPGARGNAYITTFRFPNGKKSEFVEDIVVETGTVARARATLAALKKEQLDHGEVLTAARLPSFGDQQYASVTGDVRNDEAGGWIVVRKNTIVWEVDIDTDPTAQDFGLSRPQVLAELQKYAANQKKRIGSG
jgi:hypothetical protein